MGARLPASFNMKRCSDQIWAVSRNLSGVKTAVGTIVSSLTVSPATEVNSYVLGARLEDVPNDSEISSLFRFYRLNAVAITFSLKGSGWVGPQNSDAFGIPIMSYFKTSDMDQITMPSTLQQAREYGTFKKCYFNRGQRSKTIVIRPRLQTDLTDSANAAIPVPAKKRFIPTDNKTCIHQGLWVNFDTSNVGAAAGDTTFAIECTYYFSLRGTK